MTTTAEDNNTMILAVVDNKFVTADDLLMNEEEKMMEDEEVTSVESEGCVEDTMFTMAMLNSLVDHGDVEQPIPETAPTGGGDPRPDAAPSSLDDSGRGRKRVREDEPVKTVPNPLSRPMDLPKLKPGKCAESAAQRSGDKDDCKKKVLFSDQLESSGRIRGFSIDLDSVGLELSDVHSESSNNIADTVSSGSRKRAFSFECFAFGINADEPLPTLESSGGSAIDDGDTSSLPRMRSDSIVFDPSSFQEGGIFEQAALSQEIQPPQAQPSRPSQRKPRSSGGSNTKGADGVTAFTANASVGINPSGSSTFPMELLNKDGRIGIYLPEARRARIERFHAKRSKRVWRKRIKYDCRKKLADSRPRVKGRFVKRVE